MHAILIVIRTCIVFIIMSIRKLVISLYIYVCRLFASTISKVGFYKLYI